MPSFVTSSILVTIVLLYLQCITCYGDNVTETSIQKATLKKHAKRSQYVLSDSSEHDENDPLRQGKAFDRSKKVCPSLRNSLPNGWVRLRSNSRIARFSCNEGFDLIGNRFATCIRGRWNRDLPVCVSSGCSKITPQAPLKVRRLYQGNVLDLSCDLGYFLNVNITSKNSERQSNELIAPVQTVSFPYTTLRVYCVGKSWRMDDLSAVSDATGIVPRIPILSSPVCDVYEEPVNKSMKCDFEDSLCGWFQDLDDDFDWLRQHHTTPSHLDGTGPSFDHTLGQNNSGYYLYVESSYPRVPNEVARLYSPVYQHLDGIRDVCFQFYYHMYGKAIGSLRVYVMEKSQILKELTPRLELVGDQGDTWYKAQMEINAPIGETLRPFQLVVEGLLGHGHQGDIAIDDLVLTLGKNCSNYNSSLELDPELVSEINILNIETTQASVFESNSSVNSSEAPRIEGLSSTTSTKSSFASSTTTEQPVTVLNITSTTNSPKSKNGTSIIYRGIMDNVIKAIFRPKKPTTTSTSTTSNTQSALSSTTTSSISSPSQTHLILSSTTSLPPVFTAKSTTRMPVTTRNSSTIDFHHINKRLNETSLKAQTGLNELRKLTTPITTKTTEWLQLTSTTTSASVTLINSTLPSNESSNSSLTTNATLLFNSLARGSSGSDIKLSTVHQTKGKFFSASMYLSFIAFVCLLIILASTLYIAYVYRPAQMDRANLDHFVASFVRRCKGFRSGGLDDADDAELLMMNNNNDGTLMANGSSQHNHNSDLLAYDNAHMTEGMVYLHSREQRY